MLGILMSVVAVVGVVALTCAFFYLAFKFSKSSYVQSSTVIPTTLSRREPPRNQQEVEMEQAKIWKIIKQLNRSVYQVKGDEESGEKDGCPVCFDEYKTNDQIVTLRCQHRFHFDCIKEWIETSGSTVTCPICKTKIQNV